MKKLLFVTVLLLIAVLTLAACGGGETTTAETTTEEGTTVQTTTEPITTTPETTEEPVYSLKGKKMVFLGSSVTYGSASGGYSFADEIRKQCGIVMYKQAVSGTTLVDNGPDSYVQRLVNKVSKSFKAQHVIVQLSTNDASQNKPLGKLTADSVRDLEAFDTSTIIGAIEYIICYSKETWNCPVSFYTGTKYDSLLYKRMVEALYDIQEKWDIGIIDLWNDEEMNAVSKEDYNKYMSDSIHPNKTGYVEWWTPKFIEHLQKYK